MCLSNQIRKTIMKSKKKEKKEIFYSSGSTLLDLVLGGRQGIGISAGHIINIVGDKSTGKTFLACEFIASTFHAKKDTLYKYDDAESGFTFDTNDLYGIQIKGNPDENSRTVESFYNNYREFLESLTNDTIGIYVLDSLDGLSSIEMEKRAEDRFSAYKNGIKFKEGSYQIQKAKFLSQEFFPQVIQMTEEKGAFLIIISQTRDKINSFFHEQTRAGGRALDFYCHTILWLSVLHKIVRKKRVIGVVVRAKTKKNKTNRPFRQCDLIFYFEYGLDDIGSCVDFLFDLRGEDGKLKKNSNAIQWGCEEKITIKKLIDFMKEQNLYSKYQEESPRWDLKGNEKINSIIQWIMDSEVKKEYLSKFGETKNRDELILWIEEKSERYEELKKRVHEKWEQIEEEIKPKRKKRYENNTN